MRWAVRWTAGAGGVRASGVLDALIVYRRPQDGLRVATALDVWDGLAPAVEGPLHAARRRLLALAASALCPQAQRIEVSLCFAREAEPVTPPVPAEPLAALGPELTARAALALQTLPVLLELPALPLADCERIGCEHRALCHGTGPRSGRELPGST